ncbi:proline-rich protein 23A [Camelus ferus]|uniref:Proline-rich protein 23A n=2 Tax=Camelus TaxID=9836 RepID=A0A8B8TNN8_CAMFR|nr:proline-rich protein 23A [Camelus ferus]
MGSRPRNPSAYPADGRGAQAGGPGPAKRRRTEEPAGPGSEAASSLDNLTRSPAAGAFTSVVVVAAGCALHVALDDVDLVLEPEPTSVLQVSLGDRTLMLVPEALLGSGVQRLWGQGLEQGAFLSAPEESVVLEQGFFRVVVPEIAAQEEANREDVGTEFLSAGMDAAADSVVGLRPSAGKMSGPNSEVLVPEPSPQAPNPSPERSSPYYDYTLDFYLQEPLPDSPLQPLPPSPSPGPHERPQRPHGPARKARKCLFPE